MVEDGKRAPTWPYYQSLSFLLPSVLELERFVRILQIYILCFRKRMNASVPEDNHHSRDEQYGDVQACELMTSRSSAPKARVVSFTESNLNQL